jgi:hypothetical protein
MVTVQVGEDSYRLVSGEVEGELADYGEPAVLEVDGRRYASVIDIGDDGELECLLGPDYVYELSPCPHEVQEVEFVETDEIEEVEDEGAEEAEEEDQEVAS